MSRDSPKFVLFSFLLSLFYMFWRKYGVLTFSNLVWCTRVSQKMIWVSFMAIFQIPSSGVSLFLLIELKPCLFSWSLCIDSLTEISVVCFWSFIMPPQPCLIIILTCPLLGFSVFFYWFVNRGLIGDPFDVIDIKGPNIITKIQHLCPQAHATTSPLSCGIIYMNVVTYFCHHRLRCSQCLVRDECFGTQMN